MVRGLDGPGMSPLDVFPRSWQHLPGLPQELEHRQRKLARLQVPVHSHSMSIILTHPQRAKHLLPRTAPCKPSCLVYHQCIHSSSPARISSQVVRRTLQEGSKLPVLSAESVS